MSKCRYRCGVCAGEGGRGRSVPVQGTAGEGGILKDCRHSLLHSARHIQRTLEQCGGDRDKAARLLGIGRATIYRKIRDYDLKVPQPPRRRRSSG